MDTGPKTTLSEQMYRRLRADIVKGVLRPEQPLRLDALKKTYAAGFSPLREALTRLQAERLVTSVPLKGFVVTPVSLDQMWDTIETRILIETRALRLAIAQGDDGWEAGIVASLHGLGKQVARIAALPDPADEDQQALEQRHHAFHRALIAGCGSDWLLDLSEKLYIAAERYRFPSLSRGAGRPTRDVQAEHEALAKAALARDADRAAALLDAHFRATGEQMAQSGAAVPPRQSA
jgi:DNA-binding GntR family transcriptional regulator